MLSVKPNGRDLRIVARGLRNPYGLVVDRARRGLLVSVNGRDDLGTAADPEPAEMVVRLILGHRNTRTTVAPLHRVMLVSEMVVRPILGPKRTYSFI